MPTTSDFITHDVHQAHRDRLRHLEQRLERAHGDEGHEMIQSLIESENLRYKLICDSQPQPK